MPTTISQTVTTSASYYPPACDVWTNWNVIYPTGTATTGNVTVDIWPQWNTEYVPITMQPEAIAAYNEQIRLEFEKQQKAKREAEERRVTAQKKATELLLENLDAEQRKEFTANKRFTVHVRGKEDKYYLIGYGYAGNVKLMYNGKAVAKFCIHPDVSCPNEDVMLAQKLLLETNEEQFLKIANRTALVA